MSELQFSYARVSEPLPKDCPTRGTIADAADLAKKHKCVILIYDHHYTGPRKGNGTEFRGSVGPDGKFTAQNLSDPQESVDLSCTFATLGGHANPTTVYGQRIEDPSERETFGLRESFPLGAKAKVLFRTAESEGVATEDCTTPNWYVLARRRHDGPAAWETPVIVVEGDALAAAVDAARALDIDDKVYIFTTHRNKGVCVGVAQKRRRQ